MNSYASEYFARLDTEHKLAAYATHKHIPSTLTVAVARMGSYALRTLRRRLEAKSLTAIAAGVTGTHQLLREIAVMTACGTELYNRNELLDPAPSYVDIWLIHEYGITARLQRPVRAF
ncbi:MAG: hypothetical protein ACJ8R9_05585 [Steroidobacteraceae bacterium]